MMRDYRTSKNQSDPRRRNVAAAMVAGGALAFLYYGFEPVLAEEGRPEQVASLSTDLSVSLETPLLQKLVEKTVPNPSETETVSRAVVSQEKERANRYAVMFAISQLQRGIEKLSQHDSYSVVFERLERVDGQMQDQQTIDLKLRHAPFSVYMKWKTGDKGRQLLYADKEHDGKMLIKLGGLKGRFIPTLKLDPRGDRAMAESRHPVTQAGIVNLAKEIIQSRQADLKLEHMPTCSITQGIKHNGRICTQIIVEHASAKDSPIYRKTITVLDEKLSIPVYMRNYTWKTEDMVDDEETLIECYSFKNLRLDDQIADGTWSKTNPSYKFR